MELLVMEQFLGVLLDKLQPRVVAEQPKSCKKAACLVEDLIKALAEPGEVTFPEDSMPLRNGKGSALEGVTLTEWIPDHSQRVT